MKTNKKCRRTFIKNSLAASAGLTLLGSGIKVFADETDEWRWVAFCTQHCDTCSTYTSGNCWSCKSAQGLLGHCSVKRCAIDVKNVPTCAHCVELATCDDEFWTNNPDLLEQALELQQTLGINPIEENKNQGHRLNVFPNPAKDYITISNPENLKADYELVDLTGKQIIRGTIQSEKHISLNVSGLKPGNYVLNIKNNRTLILSVPIIKQ